MNIYIPEDKGFKMNEAKMMEMKAEIHWSPEIWATSLWHPKDGQDFLDPLEVSQGPHEAPPGLYL